MLTLFQRLNLALWLFCVSMFAFTVYTRFVDIKSPKMLGWICSHKEIIGYLDALRYLYGYLVNDIVNMGLTRISNYESIHQNLPLPWHIRWGKQVLKWLESLKAPMVAFCYLLPAKLSSMCIANLSYAAIGPLRSNIFTSFGIT